MLSFYEKKKKASSKFTLDIGLPPGIESLPVKEDRNLTRTQSFLYSSGNFGAAIFPWLTTAWGIYYYAPPEGEGMKSYIPMLAVGIVTLLGQVIHAISDPLIGYLSDKTRTRWGRRIPFVIFATPPLAITSVLIWWMPVDGLSNWNAVYLFLARSAFWFFYTAVVGPYLSLLPEIARGTKERVETSSFMAGFEVVATLAATIGGAMIIKRGKGGIDLGPVHFEDGFKAAAVLVAILALVASYVSIWKIRETPYDKTKEVPFDFFRSISSTFKNPAFKYYVIAFSTFRIGLMAIIAAIPYMVKVLMGSTEEFASYLQGGIVLLAAVLIPLVIILTEKYGKKKIMTIGFLWFGLALIPLVTLGRWPVLNTLNQGILMFLLSVFPVSTLLVLPRPILADVIDHDEKLTGYRREAIYNGVEGLLTKLAEGGGPFVASILFATFGCSAGEPWGILVVGPVSGVLVLAGWLAFRKYPLEKI